MPRNSVEVIGAYSIPEAAKRLGVSRQTMWRRVGDGTIPSYRVGRLVRIRIDVVDAILTEGERSR